MRSSILVAVLGLLPACLIGSGDISSTGDDNPPPTCGNGSLDQGETCDDGNTTSGDGCSASCQTEAVPALTASMDRLTVDTELGKTEMLTVTLTSVMGFAGTVTVTPTVLDAQMQPITTGYAVLASAPTVDLAANGTAMVTVSVKIPTDATELAPTVKVDLASSLPAVDVTSALTVKKQLTITFDAGTGTGTHSSLPIVGTPIKVQSGTLLIFHNADTIQHVVHGDAGIPHEDTALGLPGGADYMVTITTDGDFYCHDHEGSGQARVFNVL